MFRAIIRNIALAALIQPVANAALAFDFHFPIDRLQQMAELSAHPELHAAYRAIGYAPIWTDRDDKSEARLLALLNLIESAPSHGLPSNEADRNRLLSLIEPGVSLLKDTQAEVEISRIFIRAATNLHSGVVNPGSIGKGISRKRREVDIDTLFAGITSPDPAGFLRGLAPATDQYLNLRRELRRLDDVINQDGWGEQISSDQVRPGDVSPAVVQLRNRLIRMGYANRTSNSEYGSGLRFAVQRFQKAHGLKSTGIADKPTISAINIEPEIRRQQVVAALERERWLNTPLGEKHIRVNIPDFQAEVISNNRSIYTTRVIVGQSKDKLQTPEFSDVMTHMTINPTWYIPRSITLEEYLPQLQEDPEVEPLLQIFDSSGQIIRRSAINFQDYTANTFPYDMKQPPGPSNALGNVKFMFPNLFSVYMHDTPARSLFERQRRNFSHGCIRVHKAHEFAHFLLAEQYDEPELIYDTILDAGQETTLDLVQPLPVHITYRTAFVDHDGRMNYRDDIYGRDAAIYGAVAMKGTVVN